MAKAEGSKYDALRAEFVAGVMSLRVLAERHGESYAGLRQAAARGHWRRLRNETACEAQREAKARAVETCAAQCQADIAAAEKLREAVQKRLEHADELPLQDIRHCAATLTDAQKLWRAALGVDGAPLELRLPWHSRGDMLSTPRDNAAAEIRHELLESGTSAEIVRHALPFIMANLTDSEAEEIAAGRGYAALRHATRAGLEALHAQVQKQQE